MPEDRGLLDLLAKAASKPPKPEDFALNKKPSSPAPARTPSSSGESNPIDTAAREVGGNDEFRAAMHAIALAESGGRPDAKGDWNKAAGEYSSIGLFQNNRKGGRGAGYTVKQLEDPLFNSRLAAKELIGYYEQAKQKGLRGADVAVYMSQYGQRPAAGNWEQVRDKWGRTVGDSVVDASAASPARSKYTPSPDATDALSVLLRGPKKPEPPSAAKPLDENTKAIANNLLGVAGDIAAATMGMGAAETPKTPKKPPIKLGSLSTQEQQELARGEADKEIAGRRASFAARRKAGAEALRSGQLTAEDITPVPLDAQGAPSESLGYEDAKGSTEERKNTYQMLALRAEQEGDVLKRDMYKLAGMGALTIPQEINPFSDEDINIDVGGGIAVALRGAASPVEEVAEVVERWLGPNRLEKKLSEEEEIKFLADVARVEKTDPSLAKQILADYEELRTRQSHEERANDVGDTKNITTGSRIADIALETGGSLATLLPEIKATSALVTKIAPKLTASQNLGLAMTATRLPQEAIEIDKGKSIGETAATLITSYVGGAAIPKVISGSVKAVEGLKRQGSKQIMASLTNVVGQTGVGVLQSATEAAIEGRQMTSEELAVNILTNVLLSKGDTKRGVEAQVETQRIKATEDAAALLPELISVLENVPQAAEEAAPAVEAMGAEVAVEPPRAAADIIPPEQIIEEPAAPTDIAPEETQAKNIEKGDIVQPVDAEGNLTTAEPVRVVDVQEKDGVRYYKTDAGEAYLPEDRVDLVQAVGAPERVESIIDEPVAKESEPAPEPVAEIDPRYIKAEQDAVIAALPVNDGTPNVKDILDYAIRNRIHFEGKDWSRALKAIRADAIAKAEPEIMARAKAKQDAERKASKGEYKIPEERITENVVDVEAASRESDVEALPEIETAYQGKAPRKGKPIESVVEGAPEETYNPKGFAEGDNVYTWTKNEVGEAKIVGGTVRKIREEIPVGRKKVGPKESVEVLRVQLDDGKYIPVHSSMVREGEVHPYSKERTADTKMTPYVLREIMSEISGGGDSMKFLLDKMRGASGKFQGKTGENQFAVGLNPALFMDPNGPLYSLTHEFGHWGDFLETLFSEGTLGRGNIVGHLVGLKNYIKDIIPKPTGTEALTGPPPARKKITDELTALSEWLRPYDLAADANYTQYRRSPKELYADAVSALIMNPAKVAEIAPEFAKLFEAHLPGRPKLQEAWTKMQAALAEPPEVKASRILRSQQEGFKTGEQKLGAAAIKGEAGRKDRAALKLNTVRSGTKIRQRILDSFMPFRKYINKANVKAQKLIEDAGVSLVKPGGVRAWERFNADQNTLVDFFDTPDAPEMIAARERLDKLKTKLGETNYQRLEAARALKGGMTLLTSAEIAYGEYRGIQDENAAMLRDVNDNVIQPVAKVLQFIAKQKGYDAETMATEMAASNYIGAFIENSSILGEHRKGTANPEWIQPDEAQSVLDLMKKNLGDDAYGLIASKVADLRSRWGKEFEQMYAEGVVQEQTFKDKASSMDSYGKFKGLEYVDVYESPIVREMAGMTGKTANPLTTGVLQSIQRNALIKRQRLINEMLPMMTREDGEGAVEVAIKEKSGRWTDKDGKSLSKEGLSADGKALLEFYRDGEKVGVLIDPAIADFINLNPSDMTSKAAGVLKSMRSFTRFNLITASPSFWYSNIARDIRGAIKTAGYKVVPQIFKNFRNAFYYRTGKFGKPSGEGLLSGLSEAQVRGAFAAGASREVTAYAEVQRGMEYSYFRDQSIVDAGVRGLEASLVEKADKTKSESDVYKFMKREGLLSGSRASMMQKVMRIGGNVLEAADRYIPFLQPWETAVKLAGVSTMLKRGLSMREAALYAREYVGTPDTSIRGLDTKVAGTFYMFMNVAAQGNMSAYRQIRNPFTRTGYLSRALMVNVLPRAFQYLISSGIAPNIAASAFGEDDDRTKWLRDMEKMYSFYSDFELMRGLNIPFGVVTDPDGSKRAEGVFIPDDEIGLMFGLPEMVLGQLKQIKEANKLAADDTKLPEPDAMMEFTDVVSSILNYANSALIPGLQPTIQSGIDWMQYATGQRPFDEFRNRFILTEDQWAARDQHAIDAMVKHTAEKLFGPNYRLLTQILGDNTAPMRAGPYKKSRAGIEQRQQRRKDTKDRLEAHSRNEIKAAIGNAPTPEAAKSIIDSLAKAGELSKYKAKDYAAKLTPEVWKYAYSKMNLEDAAIAYEENTYSGDVARATFAGDVMKRKIWKARMSPAERIAFKAKYPALWPE